MRERIFGDIEGIIEGSIFSSRIELSEAGIHRPTQAGISGSQLEGADSIVLSGGYPDDADNGNEIIYTGHGGQDQNSRRQIAHQTFTKQNQALVISCNENLPVRVIRGYQMHSDFAPAEGYRYDGLYYVKEYWTDIGIEGFTMCRFKLQKEAPLSFYTMSEEDAGDQGTQRRLQQSLRIVRNPGLARKVKEIYNYQCQVCGVQLPVVGGHYMEAAHIKALGEPHNGPDIIENLICLCPNHHVLFDKGMFAIDQDLSIIGLSDHQRLYMNSSKHTIRADFLEYHKKHFYFKND